MSGLNATEAADYWKDRGDEWQARAEQAEVQLAAVPALVEALRDFANPQHWAIERQFAEPQVIWIGTYRTSPVEHAAAALAAWEQAQK